MKREKKRYIVCGFVNLDLSNVQLEESNEAWYSVTKGCCRSYQTKTNSSLAFLTLTVRNVYDGTELNKSLSDMSKGFNRMMKYKKINKNLVGFMRATEVTVNNIDNSYKQHMHVLVCVESTYFYNTENYVNQKQWIQFWKRAMKLDYDPNVKVQMIRP